MLFTGKWRLLGNVVYWGGGGGDSTMMSSTIFFYIINLYSHTLKVNISDINPVFIEFW